MDPLAEIRALRDRLARLEAVATAATPPTGDTMESAIRDHYSPTTPPANRARAPLQYLADHFTPDPQYEATLAARARSKDPAAYDEEMKRVGAHQGLELAIYNRSRDAAIKLGTFVPAKEEGTK